MKVISTNLAKPVFFDWQGETHSTGIYKYPIDEAITLEQETVQSDTVADRRVHGGIFKACYLFSSDNYPYWKEKYSDLDWNWGMFGENLTVEGLDEDQLRIGSIYRLGTALVQITQPREPCYKLGVRFKNQDILGEFIEHACPGTYVRVLQNGQVKKEDELTLVEESESPLTIKQFYNLLFSRQKDKTLIQMAVENEALPLRKRERLKKFL